MKNIPNVTIEEWTKVARRNLDIAEPFTLEGVGPDLDFSQMLRAMQDMPQHTMFRSFPLLYREESPRRVFYLFRCTCYGPVQYEATVFHHTLPPDQESDPPYTRVSEARRSLVETMMWLANHGLTTEHTWQIVPTLPGYKP